RLWTHGLPLRSALSRWRTQPDLMTFEADLDSTPAHALELHRHRWYGRTTRKMPCAADSWPGQRYPALVVTTDDDWEPELSAAMTVFSSCREHDVLSVSFRRTSPQFSVTIPLANLA